MHYDAYFVPSNNVIAVLFPDFPGCNTQGDTGTHAISMAHEALRDHIEAMEADGDPIPVPCDRETAKNRLRARGLFPEGGHKDASWYLIAQWIDKPEEDIVPTEALKSKTVLEEAESIINGERQVMYGSAEVSFARIAGLWDAYLGIRIDTKDVAMLMMLLKIARHSHKPKRDNLVDICGYAALAEKL